MTFFPSTLKSPERRHSVSPVPVFVSVNPFLVNQVPRTMISYSSSMARPSCCFVKCRDDESDRPLQKDVLSVVFGIFRYRLCTLGPWFAVHSKPLPTTPGIIIFR